MKSSKLIQLRENPIFRSTSVLMVIALAAKLLGYVEKLVLAYYFGTGPEVDAYLLVFGVVFSVFVIAREVIEPGFLRIFTEKRAEGDHTGAWRLFNMTWQLMLLVVVPLAILGAFFPEAVMQVAAPGFEGEKLELATALTRIGFPAITFFSVSALTFITLNGLKKFALPAFGDIAMKALGIGTIFLLFKTMGIQAAALGIVIGVAGRLLVHLIGLFKQVAFVRLDLRSPDLKKMWLLSWPLLIGVLFSQASLLIDNLLVSFEDDGAIAALSYAKKLAEFPVLLFPYMLSIVVFPYFTQLAIEGRRDVLRQLLGSSLKWIVLFFFPVSLLVFLFGGPIVELAFERGAFDARSTAMTLEPLTIYAVGMTTFALETVLVLFYFANGDTKTPIFTGIFCAVLNMGLTWGLVEVMGYSGVALALVISKTLKLGILFGWIGKWVEWKRKVVGGFLWRAFAALLPTGLGLFALLSNAHFFPNGTLGKALFLATAGVVALGTYAASAYLLGMDFKLKKIKL